MTTRNNKVGRRPWEDSGPQAPGTPDNAAPAAVEVDGRRRLVLIAAAVAILVVAAAIIVGVIALERGSRVPAAIGWPASGRASSSSMTTSGGVLRVS